MFDVGETGAFLPLQQSAAYAAAVTGCGARVRWLEGGVLAVERGRLRLVSRVALDRAGLRRLALWPGLTVVTPEDGVAGLGLVPLVTPLHHAVWALGPDLRAGMARNWRGHLRQAERAGLRVGRGDAGTLEALIAAERLWRTISGLLRLTVGRWRQDHLPDSVVAPLLHACRRLDPAGAPVDLAGLQAMMAGRSMQVRAVFERHLGRPVVQGERE